MPDSAEPTTGLTKDAGWEVGVRKTVGAPVETVWKFLVGDGLPIWLGRTTLSPEKGAAYETDDDIRGQTLTYTDGFRIRLTWQPGEWDHDSTLQVTVKEAPNSSASAPGTTIAFHQERLSGREERKIMLGHWKDVVEQLDEALSS